MEKKKTILKATKKANLAAPAKKEGTSTRKAWVGRPGPNINP